ncbi:transcriptional regulator NrdR [Pigmentiphaga soli]|uniref:Transcriptional repressor NrdR n=1 Tax=Pigmentiphaga soli TaxID=1007095 RepID=A0ABP8GTN5_9BURK
MKCPFCRHDDTQVIDTRELEEGVVIRRRRRCTNCDRRFTTYERIELNLPAVVKRDGSRTEYDPAKLRASMALALRKRPVSADALEAAIAHIEQTLTTSGAREVPTQKLGELVMQELKKLDKIAYIRFASVYRSFEDIVEFSEAVREMQGPPAPSARRRPRT